MLLLYAVLMTFPSYAFTYYDLNFNGDEKPPPAPSRVTFANDEAYNSAVATYQSASQVWQSAYAAHESSIKNDPTFVTALSALLAYQSTRTDIPEEVTATTTMVTYTSRPSWWLEVPSSIRQPLESGMADQPHFGDPGLNTTKPGYHTSLTPNDSAPKQTGAVGIAQVGAIIAAGAAIML